MGTITERRLKDGKVVFTAQIRVMRDGRKTSASSTFERRAAAEAWLRRKEAEANKPGGFDKVARKRQSGVTLADAIDRYIAESERQIGKTKAQVLAAIKTYEIAALPCGAIRSQDVVAFAQELLDGGRKPQTVANYTSHLAAIFAVAGPMWGMPLDPSEMKAAHVVMRRMGITAKSTKRDRRPTMAELDKLMQHFADKHTHGRSMPMHMIVAFALFSTRRQEEITRITWADLEPGRVLVRDMKHPGQKIGNDTWVDLTPEAEAIARAMPRKSERIFPFSTDAITASFTRACRFLEIEDLHFHDLRHEGVSRLFEMGRTIPQAASVSGHRSWQSLQRYSHLRATGDKWKGWPWLARVAPTDGGAEVVALKSARK
ncbi:tyrosine-type recombinase/integrase [Paracoccus saliphilus]|uniref:Phage integrase family protein n=1 Tax=Paracoccus saliphilus TaxID=405559 RepID=A0AA45W2Z8_9RHOB|nr:site-specific integrase [Paracoccus saliphilus]WCR04989.1 site-specific integrase [Paracoccus saliphilus]SIS71639.1 Phage integrase family protein [Paracoccus saliphilus]